MADRCAHCGRSFIRSHPSQKFCGKVRGKHVCKDAFHNARRAPVETVNGMAVPPGYVGLTDQEHEQCMDAATSDDF